MYPELASVNKSATRKKKGADCRRVVSTSSNLQPAGCGLETHIKSLQTIKKT